MLGADNVESSLAVLGGKCADTKAAKLHHACVYLVNLSERLSESGRDKFTTRKIESYWINYAAI